MALSSTARPFRPICALLFLALLGPLWAFTSARSTRHTGLPRCAEQQGGQNPRGGEVTVVTSEKDKEDSQAPRKRINGRTEKPLPKSLKIKEKAEDKEMGPLGKGALALFGGGLLVAALLLLQGMMGGRDIDMPRDSYYISSSSYVIQTNRDETGEIRSKVDENSGVWTNIPGLQGRSGPPPERAREQLRATEEQMDKALQQMNREMEEAFQFRYGF
ncbi:unnamed protein product [Durusdinium trenchii]|uniref:Uncharacterized protein n=1 Tax=Durusdinium trenchii TaxID=1381693 RepID=A0ABP0MYQ3_9DINO